MKNMFKKEKGLSPKVYFKKQIDNFIIELSEQKVTIKPTSLYFSQSFYAGYVPYANIVYLVNTMVEKKDQKEGKEAENALRVMIGFLQQTYCHMFPTDEKGYNFLTEIYHRYTEYAQELLNPKELNPDITPEELHEDQLLEEAKDIIQHSGGN